MRTSLATWHPVVRSIAIFDRRRTVDRLGRASVLVRWTSTSLPSRWTENVDPSTSIFCTLAFADRNLGLGLSHAIKVKPIAPIAVAFIRIFKIQTSFLARWLVVVNF
jgi:hypothetical protein